MRQRTSAIASVLLFILVPITFAEALSNFPGSENASPEAKIQVQVEQILNQVQRALIKVQDSADSENLPTLDSVTLTLQTQLAKKAGGGFNLYVVSFAAKASTAKTQTLQLTLKPPAVGTKVPVSVYDISQNLADAILSAARGVAKARDKEPKLELSELTATIKFVVSKDVKGGAAFTILPVTFDLSGELTEASTHSVTLTFK